MHEQLTRFSGRDSRLLTILGRAGRMFRYDIHTRTPLRRRHAGRVTLLGDSAHAMVPFQARGAAQAILDAAALGDALAGAVPAEAPEALDRYVRRRLGAGTGMQARSARAGGDFHLPDGPAAEARNARMAAYAAQHRFMPQAAEWREDVPDEPAER